MLMTSTLQEYSVQKSICNLHDPHSSIRLHTINFYLSITVNLSWDYQSILKKLNAKVVTNLGENNALWGRYKLKILHSYI